MIIFIATMVQDQPRSSIKIKTYIALPDKLPRSGVCQGVVHKIWHWIQRFGYIAGEGRMVFCFFQPIISSKISILNDGMRIKVYCIVDVM